MARRYKRNLSDIVTYEKEQQAIYRKVLKEVREANRRLEKLERGLKTYTRIKRRGKYKSINVEYENFGSGTWASRKLFGRIGQYTNGKRIKISPNMNMTALRAVSKAVGQFMASKTSTSGGIKQARKNIKTAISITFGDNDEPLEERETELLYSIFSDSDVKDLMKEANINGSELMVLVKETERRYKNYRNRVAIDKMDISDLLDPKNKDKKEKARDFFVEQIQKYGDYELVNDLDVREVAQKFIDKIIDKF